MDGENGGSPKIQALYENRGSGQTANSLDGPLEETMRQPGEMELRVRQQEDECTVLDRSRTRANEQHRVGNTTTLDVCHNGDDSEEEKGEALVLPTTWRHRHRHRQGEGEGEGQGQGQGLGSADHPHLPPTPLPGQPLSEAEPKSSASEAGGKDTPRREFSSPFSPFFRDATGAGEILTPRQGEAGEALDTAGLTLDLIEHVANPLKAKSGMTSDQRVGSDIGGPGTPVEVAEPSGTDPQSSFTSSTASVVDGLKGEELTRVRRRAAELSAAIESSQSKLLQELSQVREEFFSDFGYIPSLDGHRVDAPKPTGYLGRAFRLSGKLSSAPRLEGDGDLSARFLRSLRGPPFGLSSTGVDDISRERVLQPAGLGAGFSRCQTREDAGHCNGFGVSAKGATSSSFAAATRSIWALPSSWHSSPGPATGDKGRERKCRSASPSPPSRSGWSRGAGLRRSSLEATRSSGLRGRLLSELLQKEALKQDLEAARQEAAVHSEGRSEAAKEIQLLRDDRRLNEERAVALERSARQSEQTLAKTEANLKKAAEAQAKSERSRDRAIKEYEALRRASTERILSLWFRLRNTKALRAATMRWRAVLLEEQHAKRLAKHVLSWRMRRTLVTWRSKTRVLASSKRSYFETRPWQLDGAPVNSSVRWRSMRYLRHWVLQTRRGRHLRKLLRIQYIAQLRRSWSRIKVGMMESKSEMQRARLTEMEYRLREARARADSLECQLDQSQIQTVRTSDRFAAAWCKNLRSTAIRRHTRVIFLAWADYSRRRKRARVMLCELLDRWRRRALGAGFRAMSVEARRDLALHQTLARWRAAKDMRLKAKAWTRLVHGIARSKKRRQHLGRILKQRPVWMAFERLKQRAMLRREALGVWSKVFRLAAGHRLVVQRYALRRWSSHAVVSSRAAATLRQLFRRGSARRKTAAFHCWCRATAESRIRAATARAESLNSQATACRRRGVGLAVMILVRTLERGHDRSIKWGFRRLSEAFATRRSKVRARQRLLAIVRRRNMSLLSGAVSNWRRFVLMRELVLTKVRRLVRIAQVQLLRSAVQQWQFKAERRRNLAKLAERVVGGIRRVLLTRGLRRWRSECARLDAAVAANRVEHYRRTARKGFLRGSQRELLLRCYLRWKSRVVFRRCQLRLAYTFRLARNREMLRSAFAAWRDVRRKRENASRALARCARVFERAALRGGLRGLQDWSRHREQEDAAATMTFACREVEQAVKERDELRAKLFEAAEVDRRLTLERAIVDERAEGERQESQRRSIVRRAFAAWQGVARLERRKRLGARRLFHRLRRGLLRQGFSLWQGGLREAATLGLAERIVRRSSRRLILRRSLRAWTAYGNRRRCATATLFRAVRTLGKSSSDMDQGHVSRLFRRWKGLAEQRTRRRRDISGARAKLEAVVLHRRRLRLSSAFHLWARVSARAAHVERCTDAILTARRDRTLRASLHTLGMHASSRRLARRALSAVVQSTRLRRLSRGWSAIVAKAAAAGVLRGNEARLESAEGRVAAASTAARARAHRTARRLLGVARRRAVLEVFVAWRSLVRERRGARQGCAALSARSRRRRLHQAFSAWHDGVLASSQLRSRAISRLGIASTGLLRDAFGRWKDVSGAAAAKERALALLRWVSYRWQSDRIEMRLAFNAWRLFEGATASRNDRLRHGVTKDRSPADRGRQDRSPDELEVFAEVAQDAAAAFSMASSVARVFALVRVFTPRVARLSEGRLLLFTGEPGKELYCLEPHASVSSRKPLDISFPAGNGLVGHCVTTCLPCQLQHPPRRSFRASPLSSPRPNYRDGDGEDHGDRGISGRREATRDGKYVTGETNLYAITLAGGADFHGLYPKRGFRGSDSRSSSFVGHSSWARVPSSAIDGDDEKYESGFGANSPPGGALGAPVSARWRHPHSPLESSGSPVFRRAESGAGLESVETGRPLHVGCVPVCGRGAAGSEDSEGRVMLGVLKAWRRCREEGEDAAASATFFTPAEMTSLVVLAGQAAAALMRLDSEVVAKGAQSKETEEAVKEEVKRLREAMEELSSSAQGLARQRDDARASLARAKAILRRMAPALREVRDRQLGFRHYHDLIVSMSRSLLQEESEAEGEGREGRNGYRRGSGSVGGDPPFGSGQTWNFGLSFGAENSRGESAGSGGTLSSALRGGIYSSHDSSVVHHIGDTTGMTKVRSRRSGGQTASQGGRGALAAVLGAGATDSLNDRRNAAGRSRYADDPYDFGGDGDRGSRGNDGVLSLLRHGRHGRHVGGGDPEQPRGEDQSDGRDDLRSSYDSSGASGVGGAGIRRGAPAGATAPQPGSAILPPPPSPPPWESWELTRSGHRSGSIATSGAESGTHALRFAPTSLITMAPSTTLGSQNSRFDGPPGDAPPQQVRIPGDSGTVTAGIGAMGVGEDDGGSQASKNKRSSTSGVGISRSLARPR